MQFVISLLTIAVFGTVIATAEEKPGTPLASTTPPVGASNASTPQPQKPKRDPAKAFHKLDTNHDNKITQDEWRNGRRAKRDATKADRMFSRRDKDGNRELTLEEFSAQGKKRKKNK